MIIPVILAGGTGTRLWPLSRKTYPKQFIPFYQQQSLFEKTIQRCQVLDDVGPSIVLASREHRFIIEDILGEQSLNVQTTMLEPTGKSTAPAVALAALEAMNTGQDPFLLVLPADHVVMDDKGFAHTVLEGVKAASQDYLVTFGITPRHPETGYGYIKASKAIPGLGASNVEAFVEKPNQSDAKKYVKSGDYYWNSGMFLFKASQYLAQLESHAPNMMAQVMDVWKTKKNQEQVIEFDDETFDVIDADSIDYALMEKTDKACVLPLQSSWFDVGSWASLQDVFPKDAKGNTTYGDVHLMNSKNTLMMSQRRLVTGVGLNDLVVVETPDAVLVADKAQSQAIKPLVEQLSALSRQEVDNHSQVHRPWGYFESLVQGDRFQVKKITVNLGATLSLQLHHHRSEHWVVVEGTARVTRGDEVFLLSENQSTYIPIGVKHRLENIGKIPLKIIEVQSGSYLGEDDIVRFDDDYGRSQVTASVEDETA